MPSLVWLNFEIFLYGKGLKILHDDKNNPLNNNNKIPNQTKQNNLPPKQTETNLKKQHYPFILAKYSAALNNS